MGIFNPILNQNLLFQPTFSKYSENNAFIFIHIFRLFVTTETIYLKRNKCSNENKI